MKRILFFCSLLYCLSVAADVFYCPNTYRYVDIGDTSEQVQQKCGAPASKESKQEDTSEEKPVKQWIYQLTSFQGTKIDDDLEVIISFSGNTVSGIKVAGQDLTSAKVCHTGNPIAIGDSEDTVRLNCGSPGFVSEGTKSVATGKQQVEIWTYDFGPYQPKASFKFIDGKLQTVDTLPAE